MCALVTGSPFAYLALPPGWWKGQLPETTLLTGRLHHAGPEARLLVQGVVVGAAQLVHVHAGRRADAAVVTHEHVEALLAAGWRSVHRSRLLPSPGTPHSPTHLRISATPVL